LDESLGWKSGPNFAEIKDFEYERLKTPLRVSAYRSEYIRMRDRYERTPGPPITEERKAHINMAFCTCISGS
jgi:hypothetical protein